MTLIANRVNQVRDLMKKHKLSAYLIPGTDPFLSEYLADCWNQRKFISGFTGSAGKVIIGTQKAGLWTDSRYFLQAEKELEGTGIQLYKLGLPETPSPEEWLKNEVPKNGITGVNPHLLSINEYKDLKLNLAKNNRNLLATTDFIEEIWVDRPALPQNKISLLKTDVTGESVESKLTRLRNHLTLEKVDACFISSLDEIAWLYNIRGTDIKYNPVCIAYAMVTMTHAYLYIHQNKVTEELSRQQNIRCIPFNKMENHIRSCADITRISIDASKLNQAIYVILQKQFNVVFHPSWITLAKATKNTTEQEGTKQAMVKDGVALVRFFVWLEKALKEESKVSEYNVGVKLRALRSQQKGFKDESFSTIAGYNSNGAIVHYSAQKEHCKTLLPEGVLLIDSGAQYAHGTTDITRTIALGTASNKMKEDYTLVLKGHLALSHIVFPRGTRGDQLDALARQYLWNDSLDYGHGTGHGVGHFLNVHEGPQSIRKNFSPVPLLPGMICSNEPGLYRSGEYGIRIENLILVKPKESNAFGDFLEFETLTLFPYSKKLIDMSLLCKTEVQQINAYHKTVRNALMDFLEEDEKRWLEHETQLLQN